MSYDVFLTAFEQGESAGHGLGAMLRTLEPEIVLREDAEDGRVFVRIGADGHEADVYLGPGHGMVNHAGGRRNWDLLVRGCAAAGWVIMAPDIPVCLTHEEQGRHLPDDEMFADPVLVTSGDDLLRLVLGLGADEAVPD